MDERIAYDEDFYGWSQQQAAALRDLARRRDLPNELDLEHVAEEIRDVGNAELNSVRSFLRNLLAHVIKAASGTRPEPVAYWRREIVNFHLELIGRYSPSMRQNIDLHDLWELAIRQAAADLEVHGETIRPGLPANCPFGLDELVQRDFEARAAISRVADLAATSMDGNGQTQP
jgi:hypothetical protein